MKIQKIINNNIVSSIDENGHEIILMGRGLGYAKKAGQQIEEAGVEKVFRLKNEESQEQFLELIRKLPMEYIQISNDIISHAKETLKEELNENIYLTLTDHISFAIDRTKEGMLFPNALFEEIRMFYPLEYSVGCHALYLIEKKTGIRLLEEEAASIAIHIVNAEYNSAISITFGMTQMLRDMMDIIKTEMPDYSEITYHMDKLTIGFKQLVHRLLNEIPQGGKEDTVFYEFVKSHCFSEYQLIQKVNTYISGKYQCSMTEEEKIYQAINIKRIRDWSAK